METITRVDLYYQDTEIKEKSIVCIGDIKDEIRKGFVEKGYELVQIEHNTPVVENFPFGKEALEVIPEAVICNFEIPSSNAFILYQNLSRHHLFKSIPFIIISAHSAGNEKELAVKAGIDDFYSHDVSAEDLIERISLIKNYKKDQVSLKVHKKEIRDSIRTGIGKRLFDVIISAFLLLIFSPLMLLIALLIRLESKGPVFYVSKRVGTGYRIFNFIKFRSMKVGADAELQKLLHLNQYSENGQNSSFIKISNDPRITRIGRFIRTTSLDELPQLINVLRGDMSLVGNRPLPLYEAERLTTDMWAKRFLAPAGITGLWQVTKRGKKEMSEKERILLDVNYVDKKSFWFDMGILIRTIPALLQKEMV